MSDQASYGRVASACRAALVVYDDAAPLTGEPDHVDALLQLGRIYKGQGLHGRAFRTLRRVLDLQPTHEEARGLLAELGT